jgi:nitrite reductase (NO-forming)
MMDTNNDLRPDARPGEPLALGVIVLMTVTVVLAVVGVVLGVMSLDDEGAAGGGAGQGVVAAAATTIEEVAIDADEFSFSPDTLRVEPGTLVVATVTNVGATSHDFVFGDATTGSLAPGETGTVELGPFTSSGVVYCSVPGHRENGMELHVQVTGAETAAAGTGAEATGVAVTEEPGIDLTAAPEAGFTAADATLAPATNETVHELTIRASELPLEIAPGVTQEMWTFDGRVPGPVLRGRVGDTFRITLVNDGQYGHSIDFHASRVAWDDEMRTIQPGEELVYEFVAEYAGAFMYHCGTPPALHHIGTGMYGTIIVDPPDLAPVDHELVMVQSELYLGTDGGPGDLSAMLDDDWDAVVFNGYVNQYLHDPIRVEVGDRVRVWVVDAGPSENSSFHVVGTVFDTVFKEGAYLLSPTDATQGGAQALDLQPAQGGFVEFSFAEEGFYPFVTHKFSNASQGALGLFQVGDVELATGSGH